MATNYEDPNIMKVVEEIKSELVLQLVVTCSSSEIPGKSTSSKNGTREQIWPIVGGKVYGKNINGIVIPGGGDFPVIRPDGVKVIDALYRLLTDDGETIIIHNKGLTYPPKEDGAGVCRLTPTFIAPEGKYDWLNKSIFISTLNQVPESMKCAKGENENDRLIQVFRIF